MSQGFTEAQKKKLMSIPLMKEIKKNYMEAQKGSGKKGMGKMRGGSWWDDAWSWIKGAAKDVDAWLTRTKALSTVGKVVGALGAIPGLQEFIPVGAAVTGAATALGYGKKKKTGGRYKWEKGEIPEALGFINPALGMAAKTLGYGRKGGMTANNLGQHVNPVAGTRGFVSQGMGTMVQNYQSPAMKHLGGTFPSHLQPFLTSKGIRGGSASLAIGSIGNPTRLRI